jgi:hypothetical protein
MKASASTFRGDCTAWRLGNRGNALEIVQIHLDCALPLIKCDA